MSRVSKSFCRICLNACALNVQIEGDRVTQVTGDRGNPLFQGYTCIKGRSQPAYLYHPDRLLHSLKRTSNGSFQTISLETAMDEIAERLERILEQSGPRSIASYAGTMLFTSYTTSMPMLDGLMDTIGSPMRFNTDTIDKGGKLVAESLHGTWMAPAHGFDEPDVMLLMGINPIVTFTGLPTGNPGQWLKEQKERGMKLVAIDPRRTQVAKRADLHLRPRPGFDVDILACFIRTVLAENLLDQPFVDEHVQGVQTLRHYVAPFDPDTVAARTGLNAEQLIAAARVLAGKKRGYFMAGTGPHMASQGTLTEYLVQALQSLCGYWLRAGDRVAATPTLIPPPCYKAQVKGPDPHWARGTPLGDRRLYETKAGLPIVALPEEILAQGDNRIRAMICVGGNPAAAIPDQSKTVAALKSLDLYVQVDPWMTRSSKLADYVIAPTMPLEVAAATQALDVLSGWTGYGLGTSYAHYTPAMVPPPHDAEVIDDWKFLHGLAIRLGFNSQLIGKDGKPHRVDPDCNTEELIETMLCGSRIPFDTMKQHPGGALFPESSSVVGEKDASCNERFDLANPDMMQDLQHHGLNGPKAEASDGDYPLRLLCRRHMHVYNSSCNITATHRGKPYNPAFLNPTDMRQRGLANGEIVSIKSAHGSVKAVVEEDADLAPGLVSLMFGYGADADSEADIKTLGTDPNHLIRCDTVYDRYTGQPRMSNLPVDIVKNRD